MATANLTILQSYRCANQLDLIFLSKMIRNKINITAQAGSRSNSNRQVSDSNPAKETANMTEGFLRFS
jgi:hypothetical protein